MKVVLASTLIGIIVMMLVFVLYNDSRALTSALAGLSSTLSLYGILTWSNSRDS